MAKYLILRPDGAYQQVPAISISMGPEYRDRIPATNDDGILDPSLLNAALNGTEIILMTGPDGRIDPTTLPIGVGADTAEIVAAEDIAAGAYVNIYDDAGTPKIRLASAVMAHAADGFCLESYAADEIARVYFEGFNAAVTGLSAGRVYLSDVPGAPTSVAPSTAGNILQILGVAYGATTMYFKAERPVHLA